jgi:hypothetical protein
VLFLIITLPESSNCQTNERPPRLPRASSASKVEASPPFWLIPSWLQHFFTIAAVMLDVCSHVVGCIFITIPDFHFFVFIVKAQNLPYYGCLDRGVICCQQDYGSTTSPGNIPSQSCDFPVPHQCGLPARKWEATMFAIQLYSTVDPMLNSAHCSVTPA